MAIAMGSGSDERAADVTATRALLLSIAEGAAHLLAVAEEAGPNDASALWTALVEGRWSLYDRFHAEGRRCLVARRNAPHHQASRALTAAERQVVGCVAHGCANKLVADAMGLSGSTVATHLTTAMRKLGVSTRTELVALLGELVPELTPCCPGTCSCPRPPR